MPRNRAAAANLRVPLLLMLAFIAASALSAPNASAQGRSERLAGAGPVSLEGELEVSYEDDEERGTARLVHVLKTFGSRVPLKFRGTPPEHLQTGDYVSVSGDLADGIVTTTSVTPLAIPATQTLGPRSVLIILFNFSNNPTQPFSASTVANVNTQYGTTTWKTAMAWPISPSRSSAGTRSRRRMQGVTTTRGRRRRKERRPRPG